MRFMVSLLGLFLIPLSGCEKRSTVEMAVDSGILIVGNNGEPQSFDPHVATSVADGKIINATMEGLLRGDSKDDAIFHPGVASSWQSNATADEWTFTLRKGVTWSDGALLTANDFEYAYHRILHPSFGGRYADMLYCLQNAEAYNNNRRGFILCGLDDSFPCAWSLIERENWGGASDGRNEYEKKGLDKLNLEELKAIQKNPELFSWSKSIDDIVRKEVLDKLISHACSGYPDLWELAKVGVRAQGGNELVLKLVSPMPQFPLLLLHYTWFPVPRHSLESHGGMLDRSGAWIRPGKAVSNGPFTMAEHRFNDYVEVRKNSHYHSHEKVKLNAIKYLPIVNGFTETRMFFDGKLHVTNNVPPEMSDYVREKAKDEFKQEPYYTTIFYRFNTTKYPLNDRRVRLALSMAIDRDVLVEEVGRGAGIKAFGFTPPGAGYKTPLVVEENLLKARKLLADAGFPEGRGFPHIEIMTTSREVQKTVAEAIQEMWKRNLGIHIDIRASEWTAYKQAQNTLKYDICSSSWSGDYLDPATFLDLWLSSSGNNNTGWANDQFDELVRKSRASGKMGDRLSYLRRAEELMLNEAPVIPLNWAKRSYLIRKEVKGWHPLILDNHTMEDVYLQKEIGKGDKL